MDTCFRVLIVCTANQCRSPMAEHLLRHRAAGAGLPWRVESAGVRAATGQPMHPLAAEVLAERAVDARGWVSRRLNRSMIEQADLVLTAEAEHRRAVVTLDHRALARTFTLFQFARFAACAPPLVRADPALAGAALLDSVNAVRGELQPVGRHEDDLRDPIGKPLKAYRTSADQIQHAIDRALAPRHET